VFHAVLQQSVGMFVFVCVCVHSGTM
jgi:hypothetical protein